MTARLDDERLAEVLDVCDDYAERHGSSVDKDVCVLLRELQKLRSLFTPETVAALEVGADFLQLQADRLSVLGTSSIRSKQAAALRALASAVAGAVGK